MHSSLRRLAAEVWGDLRRGATCAREEMWPRWRFEQYEACVHDVRCRCAGASFQRAILSAEDSKVRCGGGCDKCVRFRCAAVDSVTGIHVALVKFAGRGTPVAVCGRRFPCSEVRQPTWCNLVASCQSGFSQCDRSSEFAVFWFVASGCFRDFEKPALLRWQRRQRPRSVSWRLSPMVLRFAVRCGVVCVRRDPLSPRDVSMESMVLERCA